MNLSLSNTFTHPASMRGIFCRHPRLFFVGIGGIGMQGLAMLLFRRGFAVGGSDRAASPAIDRLRAMGIPVTIGHRAESIRGYDVLIYTLAADRETPELAAARCAALPCFSRADLLGYLMAEYPIRIGVAGMHGKSTTTAMLAAVLREGGLAPTVVSGAAIDPNGAVVQEGGRQVFLCEACEYRDSFLCLYPSIAVVLNCEWEHTDYFKSLAQVKASFHTYIKRARTVILPADCCQSSLPPTAGMRVLRFGLSPVADARAVNITYQAGCASFDYLFCGIHRGHVTLAVPGEHNVQNALAALAVAEACRVPFAASARALAACQGADRRLSLRGGWRGMAVYEDYAHHPTEIRASLAALRRILAGQAREEGRERPRLLCVFQPHTYSRTAAFFDAFCESLSMADRVCLLDIYAAREQNESGVSAAALAAAIPGAHYAANMDEARAYLAKIGHPGDLLVVMGAGDISRLLEGMPLFPPCKTEGDVVQ